MLQINFLLSFLLSFFSLLSSWNDAQSPQRVSMKMVTRQAQGGYTSSVSADLYYSADGRLVSYFSNPAYVVINNSKGDLMVYDQKKNTLIRNHNPAFSTEANPLYFFLSNKKSDMGLKELGFQMKSNRFEGDMIITEWLPPISLSKNIKEVELVHEKGNPIYLGYKDPNGNTIKKVYFYDFIEIERFDFPKNITTIDFAGSDSTVSKTSFSQFKWNEQVSMEKLNFEIPKNAKVIDADK